mgnify:FL=1
MTADAIKLITKMQSDIENYKTDLIALLTLVKNPESAEYLQFSNSVAQEIADEIINLQKK